MSTLNFNYYNTHDTYERLNFTLSRRMLFLLIYSGSVPANHVASWLQNPNKMVAIASTYIILEMQFNTTILLMTQ